MFSNEVAVKLHLLDHLVRRAHQGGVTVDHFFCGEGADRIHQFTIAGILARLLARPRRHGLGEYFDVAFHRASEPFHGLLMGLGDVAVEGGLNLLGAGGMPGFPPSIAVALHQLTDEIEIAGERNDHDVVAMAARPDKRFLRCDCSDPDRRMGFLHRTWHEPDVAKSVKFSLIRNPLLGPKPGDNVNAFFEACSALFHAHAEDVELLWDEGTSKSCVEPTVADVIKHRQLAGELDGVVECGYHRAGDQPDASSAGRDGGRQDDWIRTVAAVIVEVVLYWFYPSVSHPISSFRQSKCQGVVLRRGHVLQAK